MQVFKKNLSGHMLVELLMAIGLAAILFPALATSFLATREGKVQQKQRLQATTLLKETEEAVRYVRNNGWSNFSTNGTYHPTVSSNVWSLASGAETINGLTRQVVISDVYRDSAGAIVTSGGTVDPSTKKASITVSWTTPYAASATSQLYLTRISPNYSHTESTETEFKLGTQTQTQVTNTAGGEVKLQSNKAKWCSPSFAKDANNNEITIDLPDGPPVAVVASAAATTSTPNDVFVATAPASSSAIKLAYLNVVANTDYPTTTQRGTFTMDPSKYSTGTFPSTDLSNNFKTNDVKYYKSSAGKVYALLATDLPDKEVVAVQINNGSGDAYQDSVNKIYKYWTFFNTKIYSTAFNRPSSDAADSGGDGNGFGTNPTNAYAEDGAFAVDSNSGNGTGTNCTGADKDKHRFYDYDLSVPSGATINGITVNLIGKVDSTSNAPQFCVQLSWDGGTTWTTAKSTSTLTTSTASYTLGGSADTWGRTWSDSNFSNTNFRVRVINVANSTSRDFSLDFAGVKVTYNGTSSTAPNDQAPFDYGAKALTVSGNTGYVASGGYLYAFDLSTIDSKSTTNGLDQVGCRIELDGFDCKPGTTAVDKKYSAGETGTSWSTAGSAAHNDCSDGGNIETFATNDLSAVQVGGSNYIFAAVGAGTNPEFEIINATSIPDSGTSPSISSASCGRLSGGNASWKQVSSYDFNTASGTEEAANSVYAKSDGTRAYISSNGTSDSKQFYILNTTNKTAPSFLSGSPATGPSSGYYQSSGANGEMYPRRSLTVLNGKRAVLVGKDGVSNSNDAQEYQVLDMNTNPYSESTPGYCGGLNYDVGFNGLTSVSEADGDNYVYMVTNTTSNELKIIQGGPDQEYVDSGSFESQTFNASSSVSFNRLIATVNQPSSSTIKMQVAAAPAVSGSCTGVSPFPFVGPDGTASTYFTPTAASISATIPFGNYLSDTYQNPSQCFRYKTWFTATSDFSQTPVLYDASWNYSQ